MGLLDQPAFQLGSRLLHPFISPQSVAAGCYPLLAVRATAASRDLQHPSKRGGVIDTEDHVVDLCEVDARVRTLVYPQAQQLVYVDAGEHVEG